MSIKSAVSKLKIYLKDVVTKLSEAYNATFSDTTLTVTSSLKIVEMDVQNLSKEIEMIRKDIQILRLKLPTPDFDRSESSSKVGSVGKSLKKPKRQFLTGAALTSPNGEIWQYSQDSSGDRQQYS